MSPESNRKSKDTFIRAHTKPARTTTARNRFTRLHTLWNINCREEFESSANIRLETMFRLSSLKWALSNSWKPFTALGEWHQLTWWYWNTNCISRNCNRFGSFVSYVTINHNIHNRTWPTIFQVHVAHASQHDHATLGSRLRTEKNSGRDPGPAPHICFYLQNQVAQHRKSTRPNTVRLLFFKTKSPSWLVNVASDTM